jgi:hypothetical protein
VLSIVSEPFDISCEFPLSMAVAAYPSLEISVQTLRNRMVQLKAENIRFRAAEASSGIAYPLAA